MILRVKSWLKSEETSDQTCEELSDFTSEELSDLTCEELSYLTSEESSDLTSDLMSEESSDLTSEELSDVKFSKSNGSLRKLFTRENSLFLKKVDGLRLSSIRFWRTN